MSFGSNTVVPPDKPGLYAALARQLAGLIGDERDPLAATANAAALIFALLPDVNWAGFYLMRGGQLVLGPFQGQPACVRIDLGRGVCGTAAAQRRTLVVADVRAFPGHISCDAASNAEIVVPIVTPERLVGVLDLDSPLPGRFDQADAAGLEPLARMLAEGCDWRLAGIDGF